MTSTTIDDVLAAVSGPARRELREVLGEVRCRDMTTAEVLGFLALLRPVRERTQAATSRRSNSA